MPNDAMVSILQKFKPLVQKRLSVRQPELVSSVLVPVLVAV